MSTFTQTRQIKAIQSPCRRACVALRLVLIYLLWLIGATSLLRAATNPIQQENSLPGTPGWHDFAAASQQDLISGFGSKISANHGDSISFYVTTTAASYTIDIYRTGYYQGIGARLIQSLGSFPGIHQAIPAPDKVTGMVSCINWTPAATVQIPATWVTGVYVAKLTSSAGNSSFIFFVVRDDAGTADLVFQASVTTYQAYNAWGGISLYDNRTNGSAYPYAHATKVSFDRPFDPNDGDGAGHYFLYEDKFVYWLESQGYNVAYTTDVDTDMGTTPLTNHRAFLSVGHDEYWSAGMRANVQNAINAGVNAAFFSGNSVYWQIRFEPNAAGSPNRVQVGYKDFSTTATPGPDPMWGVNNAIVTTYWRDPIVNQPENGLMGVMYEDNPLSSDQSYVVSNASSWVFSNTGFVNGSSVPGIVGYEYDKVWNNGFTPPGLIVLSNSPVKGSSGSSFANSTLYSAPSGAQVFAAGTIQWSWGLANVDGNTYANPHLQQTTANILNTFISSSSASASLNPTSLSFSGVVGNTSAAQTITLTSTGNNSLTISNISITGVNAADFAQTNNCPSSLSTNQSCTINVTFTPSATGSRNASVTITDNATNSPQSVTLNGAGQAAAAPAVTLNPTSLSFGSQVVGSPSAPLSVTLSNTGTAALSISSIALSGTNSGDFSQSSNCPTGSGTLAVNASCTISVTFNPSATGARTATLLIADNATTSPQSVPLSGSGSTASAAVTLSPTSLAYSSQLLGTTSAVQTITVKSTGNVALTISGIMLSGTNPGDFSQSNNCPTAPSTLAVNASCAINVTFTPTAHGARTATLTVSSDAPGSAPSASLSGTGVAPIASLSPNSLSFGNSRLTTTSAASSVTLTNSGDATLHISGLTITGDFAQSNNCASTLAPGASCSVSVTFTPTTTGARAGALTVTDDGSNGSPQSASLSGTGVDFALSASPSSATVPTGGTGAYSVTAGAVGGTFSWSIGLACSGLPKGVKCSFASPSLTPGTGPATSPLNISTSKATPKGTYSITIVGSSGSLQHATAVTLQVN